MKKTISLLGSTGSIGRQTLEVVRELGYKVCALTANRSLDLLEQQAREFQPQLVVLYEMESALEMGNRTLMMHQGRIILDVDGEEKKRICVSDLMEKFRELSGSAMNNDRMLLS